MEGDDFAGDDSSASSGMEDIDRRKALKNKIAKLNSELFFLEKKMGKEGCYGKTSKKTKIKSTAVIKTYIFEITNNHIYFLFLLIFFF